MGYCSEDEYLQFLRSVPALEQMWVDSGIHLVKSEAMFAATDTAHAPWTVIRSNDKKRARLEALRHVLHALP